ncbi:hypothetical protein SASPL_147201 [Salvia splendens]|uniref:DUF7731 domain-containing protein n=1 Tax=Salvia splendens TaxID=180675 RepID=A0A8X8Z6E9_SALSN|nr:hypothetical protein SASPL_147201 [Salvia splendens]
MLIHIVSIWTGRAYSGDLGATEVIADEFVAEEGAEEGEGEDQDPIFINALECFNDRNAILNYVWRGIGQIYSICDEEYRLSEKGEVKVPRECADQYCQGPCREETNLVLECIQQIFHHFRFYNKATLNDVRETINAACSYGPKRGDFDVAEHVRVDEDSSSKLMSSYIVIYAALLMILGWRVLF